MCLMKYDEDETPETEPEDGWGDDDVHSDDWGDTEDEDDD